MFILILGYKDGISYEDFLNRQNRFFNLAEELKSFIVLYILSFYIIVLSAEKKLYSYLF